MTALEELCCVGVGGGSSSVVGKGKGIMVREEVLGDEGDGRAGMIFPSVGTML